MIEIQAVALIDSLSKKRAYARFLNTWKLVSMVLVVIVINQLS